MQRVVRFSVSCVGAVAVVLGLIWVFGGFDSLDLDAAGVIALCAGILFTVALGVGLMAAIFYGERDE